MFCERRNGYELRPYTKNIDPKYVWYGWLFERESLLYIQLSLPHSYWWDMTYDIHFHCWFPISSLLIFHTRHGSECHFDSIMLLMDVSSKLNIWFYLTSFGFDQTLGLTNCRHYERLLSIIDANNVCYPAFGNLCNEGPRSLNFFLSI